MITPQFEVNQDADFVYVDIKAPYIKASLIQFEVSDDVFVFTLPPYFLRLRFPGYVIENDLMSSSYDLGTSTVHCKISKLHPGQHFEDLDMITKLLATKSQQNNANHGKPLIQDLDCKTDNLEAQMQQEDFDWEVEQEIPIAEKETVKYGFNNQYSERVGLSMHTGNEINELADPEHESAETKLRLMVETTMEEFDASHYLADFYDTSMIDEILRFQMPSKLILDSENKDRVAHLGNREFFISNLKSTYVGILPLLFAWAYDYRTNIGEHTVESSWNVGKLVPSMCFLYNGYNSVIDVVKHCTARSLTKPLYRNWKLSLQVWQDTIKILEGRKANILTVFASLLGIFENDLHSVYRQILIEDYTIWIQYSSDSILETLKNELEKALSKLDKTNVGLPLLEAENGDLHDDHDSDDDSD